MMCTQAEDARGRVHPEGRGEGHGQAGRGAEALPPTRNCGAMGIRAVVFLPFETFPAAGRGHDFLPRSIALFLLSVPFH